MKPPSRFVRHISFVSLFVFFLLQSVFSQYIEGTDTTDANGYGLDSVFQIKGISIWPDTAKGRIIACYRFDSHWCKGYFNYSFDEIMLAPDTVRDEHPQGYELEPFCCLVVQNKITNVYSKIRVTKKISGNRYAYRFGTRLQSGNRLLVSDTYDKHIRYNVNNLHYSGIPYSLDPDSKVLYTKTLSWDPPLTGTNSPTAFRFFTAKTSVDTSKPVIRSLWDSIPVQVTPSTKNTSLRFEKFPDRGYVNLVTVYSGGSCSDFLDGWTPCMYDIVGIRSNPPGKNIRTGNEIEPLIIDNNQTGRLQGMFTLSGRRGASVPYVLNGSLPVATTVSGSAGVYLIATKYRQGTYHLK